MGQCNVEISARQSGVVPSVGDHRATQISRTPRGLELIKSCAKFYANGVAAAKPAAKPTVQLSHPTGPALNQSATSPSGVAKVSISTVATIFLFFLVLPSLALAAIVWWGATAPAAKGLEEAAGYASASPAQTASRGVRPPRSLQEATGVQAVSNAQSDIVIHKVKTQPIAAGTWGGPDSDGRPSAEISATD
jgi:hypothetical protein